MILPLLAKDTNSSIPIKVYSDCAKDDLQCQKERNRRIENDRIHYEKWCKKHPGHCSKKIKLF